MIHVIQGFRKIPIWVWINAIASAVSVSLYVFMSYRTQAIGFPLDDAWIHQTYARNLADLGEWSFIPGVPSAGSTSPLWTLFLSLLHLISNQTPYLLTFLLGAVCLWCVSNLGEWLFRWETGVKTTVPLAGIFLALEWHLVWAGASGMETLLTAAIILTVFVLLRSGTTKGMLLAGLLTGIGVWVRPDTVTLAGPMLFYIFFHYPKWKDKLKISLWSLGIGLIPFLGYLIFNQLLSGQFWPNTFYAKQAEYAVMQQSSILVRYGRLMVLPMVGAGSLLLPGFVYKAVESIKRRDWYWIGVLLWWFGYNLIYASSLPVTYQHGRYLIPAMPVFFLTGLIGSAEWIGTYRANDGTKWVLQKVWQISLVLVLMVFFGLGASSYARDVAIINTEMAAAAKWINENTASDDLIAVHDIGAVGYFSQRNIIDLAGLVTPEVIPIIRDEEELAKLLDERNADYLMTFPSWYSTLADDKPIVFTSGGLFSPLAGGENMTIYRWKQE